MYISCHYDTGTSLYLAVENSARPHLLAVKTLHLVRWAPPLLNLNNTLIPMLLTMALDDNKMHFRKTAVLCVYTRMSKD